MKPGVDLKSAKFAQSMNITLASDRATIDKFIAAEPRLKVYELYLDDILRRRALVHLAVSW